MPMPKGFKSVEKIAKNVTDMYRLELDKNELNRIAKDPRFQSAIMSFMHEID